MTIREMQKEAHQNAREKGFWEGKDPVENLPQAIALMHSELSEALEDVRNPNLDPRKMYFEDSGKPCGVPSEFADAVIRIMDNCEALGIDLHDAIEKKMAYNKTRPRMHGGKNF